MHATTAVPARLSCLACQLEARRIGSPSLIPSLRKSRARALSAFVTCHAHAHEAQHASRPTHTNRRSSHPAHKVEPFPHSAPPALRRSQSTQRTVGRTTRHMRYFSCDLRARKSFINQWMACARATWIGNVLFFVGSLGSGSVVMKLALRFVTSLGE